MVLVKIFNLKFHTSMSIINMIKKQYGQKAILFVSILSLTLFIISPLTSLAFLSPADGGLDILAIPCTCTLVPSTWNFFLPLYINSVIPASGSLVYTFGTQAFAYYAVYPTVWQLGIFIPGVQDCLVGAPPACVPMGSLGQISPFTGSSLPSLPSKGETGGVDFTPPSQTPAPVPGADVNPGLETNA